MQCYEMVAGFWSLVAGFWFLLAPPPRVSLLWLFIRASKTNFCELEIISNKQPAQVTRMNELLKHHAIRSFPQLFGMMFGQP